MDIKDIFEGFSTDKGNWRFAFYGGIFVTISLLLILGSGNVFLHAKWISKSWDLSASGKVLGFPEYSDPSLFSVHLSDLEGECMKVLIIKGNGQEIQGTYCKNDKIIVDDYIVEVKDVKVNSKIQKPIRFTAYKILDFGALFKVLLFLIPLFAVVDKVNQIKRKKTDDKISEKKKTLAKKFKVNEKDMDDLIEFTSEYIEE